MEWSAASEAVWTSRGGGVCTVYATHCTVYVVQCTLHTVQCMLYSVRRTVYSEEGGWWSSPTLCILIPHKTLTTVSWAENGPNLPKTEKKYKTLLAGGYVFNSEFVNITIFVYQLHRSENTKIQTCHDISWVACKIPSPFPTYFVWINVEFSANISRCRDRCVIKAWPSSPVQPCLGRGVQDKKVT